MNFCFKLNVNSRILSQTDFKYNNYHHAIYTNITLIINSLIFNSLNNYNYSKNIIPFNCINDL